MLWLYGTLHDMTTTDVPSAAWDALDGAAVFVSELGDTEPDRDRLRELMRLPRGKGLDQLLPTDDWWDLRDTLRGTIREDELKRARPWYAMSLLTRTLSPPPDPQMDVALTLGAKDRGLPIEHLETWDEQLAELDTGIGIPDLIEAIDARRTMRCDLARNRASYAAGDAARMRALFASERSRRLLGPRNRRWLPRLEGYLAGRGAFVAVGIGHLVGDDNVPSLLEAAGYRVTPPSSVGGDGAAPAPSPPPGSAPPSTPPVRAPRCSSRPRDRRARRCRRRPRAARRWRS